MDLGWHGAAASVESGLAAEVKYDGDHVEDGNHWLISLVMFDLVLFEGPPICEIFLDERC